MAYDSSVTSGKYSTVWTAVLRGHQNLNMLDLPDRVVYICYAYDSTKDVTYCRVKLSRCSSRAIVYGILSEFNPAPEVYVGKHGTYPDGSRSIVRPRSESRRGVPVPDPAYWAPNVPADAPSPPPAVPVQPGVTVKGFLSKRPRLSDPPEKWKKFLYLESQRK